MLCISFCFLHGYFLGVEEEHVYSLLSNKKQGGFFVVRGELNIMRVHVTVEVMSILLTRAHSESLEDLEAFITSHFKGNLTRYLNCRNFSSGWAWI